VRSERALVDVVLFAGITVAGVASGTGTGEASGGVHAGRCRRAIVSIAVTLVDVSATVASDARASVARRTDAGIATVSASLTSCHWIAVGSVTRIDVDGRALVAVAFVAVAAGAFVLAVVVAKISAICVNMAVVLTSSALVDLVWLAAVAVAVVAVIACASVAADSVYALSVSVAVMTSICAFVNILRRAIDSIAFVAIFANALVRPDRVHASSIVMTVVSSFVAFVHIRLLVCIAVVIHVTDFFLRSVKSFVSILVVVLDLVIILLLLLLFLRVWACFFE